ncbi:MAG TPA: CAP domain-containing protein [Longimicrobiaceae bacterium]|nr:CAP domain-containing protein [Longimicrobiaceae bacterium]
MQKPRSGVRSAAPFRGDSTDSSESRLPHRRRCAWAALMLAAVLGGCDVIPTGSSLASSADVASAERDFTATVNQHRASLGCPALVRDDRVAAVALAHSRDMATRNYFSHNSPEGVTPWQRLASVGVRYATAGENIAWGVNSAGEAYSMWMNSAPHRRNIENCAFTHHGVGVYDGRWTHVFIRPS